MTDPSEDILSFDYEISFSNGQTQKFEVRLDAKTLSLIPETGKSLPDWTRLSFCQCPGCPLKPETHPHCPVAANLAGLVDFAQSRISHEEVDVKISTQDRMYQKHTALQYAVSSLMGLVMATSGCPIMDRLRPMVRTHLPFASVEETIYRMISMYLLAQYFVWKKGGAPDWELKDLCRSFEQMQTVNESFWKRIKSVHGQDAGLNALVHLDVFTRFTNMLLVDNDLGELEKLFKVYLDPPNSSAA